MCGISVVVALNQSGNLIQAPQDGLIPLEGLQEERQIINGSPNITANGVSDGTTNKILESTSAMTVLDKLDDSLKFISHRGPDASAKWISPDGRVGLGHVRLSINDLTWHGNQPFHDEQETVHVVVNGELYDADRIREELERDMGYTFTSRSDCEIAVAMYKQHGISFLSHLRGEFSLCLYDSRAKFFFAARDRYGIKPLFWTVVGNRLLVASEAKAFLSLDWKPKWDVKSLMDEGWRHDQRTPFEGVNKVRPGHYLTCNSLGMIETRQYWDLDFPDKSIIDHRSAEHIIEGVRSRMLEAVRLRMCADVPVGVYLSGGVDSSAVAGMMCHLAKEDTNMVKNGTRVQQITCFSIAFDKGSGMDESDIAERTAQHLGLPLVKKMMNEEEIAKRFEDAVWHSEHQNYDLNFVGKFALSEAPRDLGYKVVLTGEGADEVFGGYPAHLSDYLHESDDAWPDSSLSDQSRERYLVRIEAENAEYYKGRALSSLDGENSLASRQLNKVSSVLPMANYKFPLFAPWTTSSLGESDPRMTIANNVDGRVRELMMNKWHPLHSALYIWTKGNLANVLLACLGDRSEMAHSIEGRVPFIDHKLAEYVNYAPPSAKIRPQHTDSGEDGDDDNDLNNQFSQKWVLREAAKPFLTHEVYTRKKHGYAAPTKWTVDGPLHTLFKRLLTEENVERLGFVDWRRAKNLVQRAFVDHDTTGLRQANVLAQYVVLSQRFGIETARPPRTWA